MEEKYKQEPAHCIKVVLFGPESTGKTTLSKQLAEHYNSVWVPEYAREYLQKKWNEERETCEPEDLLPIAEGQMKLENELAKQTNSVLICDTDLLETKVYSEAYYQGSCDPMLEKFSIENTYNLYFLTYIDIPWKKDDLRDRPEHRKDMFDAFHNELIKHNRPFVLLKGDKEERLKIAIEEINKLLKVRVMLTEKDIKQIDTKGITADQVDAQVARIKNGMSFSNLVAAATIGQGIERFSKDDIQDFIESYESKKDDLSTLKFVPASGAATRMFKFLFQFLKQYNPNESIKDYANKHNDALIETFFDNLETFPFYKQVVEKANDINSDFDTLPEGEKYLEFVKTMLDEDGLNYSFLPKGLLPFHKYGYHVVTAFKEHMLESTLYASSRHTANLHFTVSEKHLSYFKAELEFIRQKQEMETTIFNISFSYQKEATETVALTEDGHVFRNEDDSILFRPAGHGALLENLNELDHDIIFIKNVDNIVVANKNVDVSEYKKLLAGILIETQEQVFSFLHKLDEDLVEEAELLKITSFLSSKVNGVIHEDFEDFTLEEKRVYLREKLNRPIRVCGMVKNEGEPGGGPFWVKDENGEVSLQIVEFAQINVDDTTQKDIVKNATHFNPTDLVCGVRNYKGEKFDLKEFVDPEAAFITMKTQNGIDIKALELPGLWNGSMAHWNSIFVEVPLETFNPVKTVNDLLKPAHQVTYENV